MISKIEQLTSINRSEYCWPFFSNGYWKPKWRGRVDKLTGQLFFKCLTNVEEKRKCEGQTKSAIELHSVQYILELEVKNSQNLL